MLVKVCGMRDCDNILELLSLRVDMVGFIFYPKSARYIGDAMLPEFEIAERVGVFVDSDISTILEHKNRYNLTTIQLHGSETTAMCESLKTSGIKVIKAISIKENTDFQKATAYDGVVDYMLFDTKCDGYGGSGVAFDWSLLDSYSGSTPFLLSGGITVDMAEQIANIKHPKFAGVDLNSRFEKAPALKDIKLLKKFIQSIKGKF
ncbi:MAG: phosphoribosylanthranilate isomerase [Rikenellaceae bacterium]